MYFSNVFISTEPSFRFQDWFLCLDFPCSPTRQSFIKLHPGSHTSRFSSTAPFRLQTAPSLLGLENPSLPSPRGKWGFYSHFFVFGGAVWKLCYLLSVPLQREKRSSPYILQDIVPYILHWFTHGINPSHNQQKVSVIWLLSITFLRW